MNKIKYEPFKFQIDKQQVIAKSRKLSTNWKFEILQDLSSDSALPRKCYE